VNLALAACGVIVPDMSAVVSVWMSPDARYSFAELISADVALVTLGLNGIAYMGHNLKISRPNTYSV
jgi:hypothetical protein